MIFRYALIFLIFPYSFIEASTPIQVEPSGTGVFYVGKVIQNKSSGKPVENLYFVMEKIESEDQRAFWANYIKAQNGCLDSLNVLLDHPGRDKTDYNKIKDFRPIIKNLNGGIVGFQNGLKYLDWVAYAYVGENPLSDLSQRNSNTIEMAMTVMTSNDTPFVTHMGIARAPCFIRDDRLREQMHKRISVDLHAFAAKIMNLIEPQKLYMVTIPMKKMAEILRKVVPGKVFVGDDLYAQQLLEKINEIVPIEYTGFPPHDVKIGDTISAQDLQELVGDATQLLKSMNEVEDEKGVEELMEDSSGETAIRNLESKIDFLEKYQTYLEIKSVYGGSVPIIREEDGTFIMLDEEGQTIFEANKREHQEKGHWFFIHTSLANPTISRPYVTVNLEALASAQTTYEVLEPVKINE